MKGLLFWVLSLTWGILMTAFGLLVSLVLLIAGVRPSRWRWFLCFEVGAGWGGFECGPMFVVERGAPESMRCHEAGHGVQNILFGPLMPFLVSIPSAVRYWARRIALARGRRDLPPYDGIWFEGQATRWGTKLFGGTQHKPRLRRIK